MKKHPVVLEVEIDGDDVYIRGKKRTDNVPVKIGSIHRYGRQFQTHRIVAEIACERPEGYNAVKFKDGNKRNIRPSNLEWAKTRYDNKVSRKTRKLTKDQVMQIVDMLNRGEIQSIIASQFGVNIAMISSINRGVSYSDITGIDKNKIHPKGRNLKALPNGKYAFCVGCFEVFDTYEEASERNKEYWRKFYGRD